MSSNYPMPTSRELVVAACTSIISKVRHLGDCALPHLTEMAAYAFDDATRGIEEVCQELVNELPLGDDLLRGDAGNTPDDLRRQISTLRLELSDSKQQVQRLSSAVSSMDAAFTRRSELCRQESGKQYTTKEASATSGGSDLSRYLNFILEVTDAKEPEGISRRLQEARKLLEGTPNEQALMVKGGGQVGEAIDTIVSLRHDNGQLEGKLLSLQKCHAESTASLQKEIVGLRRKIHDDDAALKEVRTIQRRLEKRARKMGQALRQAMADRQAMLLSANLKEVEARTQRHLMAQQVASLETRLEVELRRRLGKASAADDPSNLEATHDLYLDASSKRLRNPNREMLDRLVKECEACPSDPSVTVSAARALRIRLNSQSEELALWRSVAVDANAKRQAAMRQAITVEEDLGRLLASARERGVDLPSDLANARLKADLQGLTDGDANYREMVRTLRSERAETMRRIHVIRRDLEVLLEGVDVADARKTASEWAKSRREGLGTGDVSNLDAELVRFEAVSGELENKLLDDSKARRMAQRDLELVDKRLAWERQLTYRQWRVLINSLPPAVGSQIDANGVVAIRNDECSEALANAVTKWKGDVHQFALSAIQAAEESLACARGVKHYAHIALEPIEEHLLLAQTPSLLSIARPARLPPPPPPAQATLATQTDPPNRARVASTHNLSFMRNTSAVKPPREASDNEDLIDSTFLTTTGDIMQRTTIHGRIVERKLISSSVQVSPSISPRGKKSTGTISVGASFGDDVTGTKEVGCIAKPKVTLRGTQVSTSDYGTEVAVQCDQLITTNEGVFASSGRGMSMSKHKWRMPGEGSRQSLSVSRHRQVSISTGEVRMEESMIDGDLSAETPNNGSRFDTNLLSLSGAEDYPNSTSPGAFPDGAVCTSAEELEAAKLSGESTVSALGSPIIPVRSEPPTASKSRSVGGSTSNSMTNPSPMPAMSLSSSKQSIKRGSSIRSVTTTDLHPLSTSAPKPQVETCSRGMDTDAVWITCPACGVEIDPHSVVSEEDDEEPHPGHLPDTSIMAQSTVHQANRYESSVEGASSFETSSRRLVPTTFIPASSATVGVQCCLINPQDYTSPVYSPINQHRDRSPEQANSPLFDGGDGPTQSTPVVHLAPAPTLSGSSVDPLDNIIRSDVQYDLSRSGIDDNVISRPGSASKSAALTKRPTSSSGSKLPRPSTPKVRSLSVQMGSTRLECAEYDALLLRLATTSLQHHAASTPPLGSTADFAFEGAQDLLTTSRLLHQCAALVNTLLLTASAVPMGNLGTLAQLPTLTYQMVCTVEATLRDLRLGDAPLPGAVPYLLCSSWGAPPHMQYPEDKPLSRMGGQHTSGAGWGSSTMKRMSTAEGSCIDALSAATDKLGLLPTRLASSEATKLRSVVGALSEQLSRLLPTAPPPLLNLPRSHSSGDANRAGANVRGWDVKRPASGLSTSHVSFEGPESSRSLLPSGKLGRKPPLGNLNGERAQLLLRSLSPPVPMFHPSVPTLQVLSPPPSMVKRLSASPNVAHPSNIQQSIATAFQTQFKKGATSL